MVHEFIAKLGLLANTINEATTGSGVTISTVPIKNGLVDGYSISTVLGPQSHVQNTDVSTTNSTFTLLSGDATNKINIKDNAGILEFWKAAYDGYVTTRANIFQSVVATGTSPLLVNSTTAVTNLNADMVDGYHWTSFVLGTDSRLHTQNTDTGTTSTSFQLLTSNSGVKLVNNASYTGLQVTTSAGALTNINSGTLYIGSAPPTNATGIGLTNNIPISWKKTDGYTVDSITLDTGNNLIFKDGYNLNPGIRLTNIVTGPDAIGGGSTDNAMALWNGTTGNIIKNSTMVLGYNAGPPTESVFSTTNGAITFKQTGGTYGGTSLTMMNETGQNGAMFQQLSMAGIDVVDFMFRTQKPSQFNFRHEARVVPNCINAANYAYDGYSGEFQFRKILPVERTFAAFGPAVNSLDGYLGIGKINPTVALDVVGDIVATGNIIATGLDTTTNPVMVSSSTSPSTGQVLTATSATTANWQKLGTTLAAVTATRTTTQSLNTTFFNISYDSTPLETDGYTIDHPSTNLDRIVVKSPGQYFVSYFFTATPLGAYRVYGQILKNGLTVIPGSQMDNLNSITQDSLITCSFITTLTTNDYLSVQGRIGTGTATVLIGASISVFKMDSIRGATGSGSNIIIQDDGYSIANTPHSVINFDGGLNAVDNGAGTATIIGNFKQSVEIPVTIDSTTTATAWPGNTLITTTFTIAAGGIIIADFKACHGNSNAARINTFRITIDGTSYRSGNSYVTANSSSSNISLQCRVAGLAAGAHTVLVQWFTSANSGRIRPVTAPDIESASLILMEVYK